MGGDLVEKGNNLERVQAVIRVHMLENQRQQLENEHEMLLRRCDQQDQMSNRIVKRARREVSYCHTRCQLLSYRVSVTVIQGVSYCHTGCQLLSYRVSVTVIQGVSYSHTRCQLPSYRLSVTVIQGVSYCHTGCQ